MITSNSNSKVKNLVQLNTQGKARRQQGLFLVEGIKMFREAPTDWVEEVYVAENFLKEEGNCRILEGYDCEVVTDGLFKHICDTKTPQGILTVLKIPSYNLGDLLKKDNVLVLVLEDLQDPGNLGTILRTGEGAGVDGVILTRNSVDLFNPKTIRSTMGSIYRMPFVVMDRIEEIMEIMAQHKIKTYAAHLEGERDYDQVDYRGNTAFLIGNEGNGLTEVAANLADSLIKIPMEGQVESLNAAMASGILAYEAYRQRRTSAKNN